MTNPIGKPRATPPRGTTRVTGERPPDQAMCLGCGTMISRRIIACKPCWRTVPGVLKAKFGESGPGSSGRSRVVAEMRAYLRNRGMQGPVMVEGDDW